MTSVIVQKIQLKLDMLQVALYRPNRLYLGISMYLHICMQYLLVKIMILKESREVYLGRSEGRKGKRDMLLL